MTEKEIFDAQALAEAAKIGLTMYWEVTSISHAVGEFTAKGPTLMLQLIQYILELQEIVYGMDSEAEE